MGRLRHGLGIRNPSVRHVFSYENLSIIIMLDY